MYSCPACKKISINLTTCSSCGVVFKEFLEREMESRREKYKIESRKDLQIIFKWIIFLTFIITTPCIFFAIASGGFIPVAFMLPLMSEGVFGFVVVAIHLLIYTPIFYYLSRLFSWALFEIRSDVIRNSLFAIFIALLWAMTFMPIYSRAAHSTTGPYNLWSIQN